MDYFGLVKRHFGYLVDDLGFQITSRDYDPLHFGNWSVHFQRGELQVRIIQDRSQVFVEFSHDGKHWEDKERILQTLGVSMSRYKLDSYGLWKGYEIKNQGKDLRKHFDLLIKHLESGQPPNTA